MKRNLVPGASAVLGFVATSFAWGGTTVLSFDTPEYGPADPSCTPVPVPPLFNRPEAGSQTAAYIVDPAECGQGTLDGSNGSDSLRTSSFSSTPPSSNELRFSWEGPANDDAWLRLITSAASGVTPRVPSPTVDIRPGSSISMDVLIYGVDSGGAVNPAGRLEFALIIRETNRNLPLGVNGGASGGLEFVGVDCVGVAPGCPGGSTTDTRTTTGGVPVTPSDLFSTIKWEFVSDGGVTKVDVSVNGGAPVRKDIAAFTPGSSGNGVLSTSTRRAVLDGLAIRKSVTDDVSKKWFINIDNIVIDAPGIIDPVLVNGPLSDLHTSVTITHIDAAATEVRLFRNAVQIASATTPPEDFSDGAHTFTGLVLEAGEVITATQVIDGTALPVSYGLTVIQGLVLEDFTVAPVWNGTPATAIASGTWYEINSKAFASIAAITWENSAALRIDDGGNMNGVYTIYDGVVPQDGTYQLKVKVHMTEDAGVPDGAQQYQVGVVVNGVHRDVGSCVSVGCNTYSCHNESLLAVDATLPGHAIGSYQGITTGNDTGLPPQEVTTGMFDAHAGDSLLVVFSTNVETQWKNVAKDGVVLDPLDPCEGSSGFPPTRKTASNEQGTWNWRVDRTYTAGAQTGLGGGWEVKIDDIRLIKPVLCTQTPPVGIRTPLVSTQTLVTVTGVNAAATGVTVYANGTPIGTAAAGGASEVVITVSPALAAGQTIVATQTVSSIEGCVPTVGPVVDDCNQVGAVSVVGPVNAGASSVGVSGISASATAVTVYVVGGAQIGQLTILSGDGTEDVPVTPLIKGQTIAATQTLPASQASAGSLQGCVPAAGQIVGSGGNASIRLSLGVREVAGLAGPVGADGGAPASTPIEWIIPNSPDDPNDGQVIETVPQGVLIVPGPFWQTVTFDPATAHIASFNLGDNALNGAYGVFEHLAITINSAAPDVGPYTMYIDNVTSGGVAFGGFEAFELDSMAMFHNPGQSGTSGPNIATPPNSSKVTDVRADTGTKSVQVQWRFRDEAANRWVRLTTFNTPSLPNPQIDLTAPITMRVLLLPHCPLPVFADVDGDTDVDGDDFAAFQLCFNPAAVTPNCACWDRDGSGGVGLPDFTAFTKCVSGPAIPWSPTIDCP